MKKEYTPPRDKFGAVVKKEPARAEFAGGGTLRAADLTKESFQPDWEPMAVPVWETIVNAVLTRVPNYLYQELVHARLAQVETVPDWDRHWICHPDAFEGLVSHPDFCFPLERPDVPDTATSLAVERQRSGPEDDTALYQSGNEVVRRGIVTRQQMRAIMGDVPYEGHIYKALAKEGLVALKCLDEERKSRVVFFAGRQADWNRVLAKFAEVPVRSRRRATGPKNSPA